MRIVEGFESISIITDDGDLFVNLGSKIKNNFFNAISSRDKVILFYNEIERIQRKYFLHLIGTIYTKLTGSVLELQCANKNIKLIYKKSNSLQIVLNIDVRFDKANLIFDLKNSEELFNKYLIHYLKGVRQEYFKEQNILVLTLESAEQINIFDNLFSFNEHLKYTVNFNFDSGEFEKFKKRVSILSSDKFTKRFSMLANLLEEHFKTLGCSIDDDFDKVRSNYLELTKIYHPDRHSLEPKEVQKNYMDKFQKIGFAYESLKPYFREQEHFISA